MKLQARWALLSVAHLVAAAAWASITTDYDHNVNFINFKTYSLGQAGNWEFHLGRAHQKRCRQRACRERLDPSSLWRRCFWSMRSGKPILSTR